MFQQNVDTLLTEHTNKVTSPSPIKTLYTWSCFIITHYMTGSGATIIIVLKLTLNFRIYTSLLVYST